MRDVTADCLANCSNLIPVKLLIANYLFTAFPLKEKNVDLLEHVSLFVREVANKFWLTFWKFDFIGNPDDHDQNPDPEIGPGTRNHENAAN